MKKKLLTIMICFAMITSFVPTLGPRADAATKTMHYVAVGDSAAMGYGMSPDAGYGILTEGTYPALINNTFAKRGIAVSTDQLAMKGMRVEELRFLLDSSYAGDGYLKENFSDLSKKRSEYRTKIGSANLISLQLGDENFSSYVLYLAQDIDNRCTDAAVKKLVASDKDKIKTSLLLEIAAAINQIPALLRNQYNVDQVVEDNIEKYIDAAAYVYYSFCMNFDESVSLIKKLNPSCDLIVLGLKNPYDGLELLANVLSEDNPLSLAIGNIYYNQVVKKANAHMKSNGNVTGFIDTRGTANFMDDIAAYKGDPAAMTQSFKDYCDIYEDDFLLASAVEELDGYEDLSDAEKEAVMDAAYDVVGRCICDVATLSQPLILTLPYSRLKRIQEELAGIPGKVPELMAGIKNAALECAKETIADSSYTYQDTEDFVSAGQYGSTESDQETGKIIMAFGIRTAMGEGFFSQPSAKGHTQISSAVMKLYDGFCSSSSVGHKYGSWQVVSAPGFCKDGTSKRICSRCGHVDVKTVSGYGPDAIKIKKLKKGKKSFTVKWKKLSKAKQKKITGFQIRYSTSKSMKKVKTVTVKKKKASSKKIKKLKSKKTYYVQIRTYKNSGGKNYYSAWSGKKKIKTK